MEAADLCEKHGLYKEHAYLLLKIGNKDAAIKVLIEQSSSVGEVI